MNGKKQVFGQEIGSKVNDKSQGEGFDRIDIIYPDFEINVDSNVNSDLSKKIHTKFDG